ncbi:putative transcription factor tau subunit sfc1 protein [Phaeoacremonium minimum UCRPA7]|uniref:Putative transcription factor tau subunit sfc1 protein n=1 Tax=Phaeoacremonium minimum (strain UCR-PA7) TaxID=1286976 RepID=R8BQ50_PHAM7|nr:putative transcription factor tau subunit sfc1 protein [Phaeoacremonium minimum UCRPA7]EOO01481.1 putative transcription factor tau subunit sfc1 protein [Phaeoacremonium minimum UCRPA7]
MIVKDVDKAIKTFGNNPAFSHLVDPDKPQVVIPLYLRYDNPASRPVASHYAASHNILLKITVPTRTGRKRKRGSDEPFQGDTDMQISTTPTDGSPNICSNSQLDDPKLLRRKLEDNVGRYQVEPVGVIKHTHRYRGMADFSNSIQESPFMTKFIDKALSGEVAKLREFTLDPGTARPPRVEIIAPPTFTHMTLPFSYNYTQNSFTRVVDGVDGTQKVVNVTTRAKNAGFFIQATDPSPGGPRTQPNMKQGVLATIIRELEKAMEERPIWTRRSIINRLASVLQDPSNGISSRSISSSSIRHGIQYVGYQFKGGPWRDAVVKYGVDPRSDPKYRQYQTLIFRLRRVPLGAMGTTWQSIRKKDVAMLSRPIMEAGNESHVFDGVHFSDDGKVWQVCDVTDPLLARLLAEAPMRPTCDEENSGWYHRGSWAKIKAIMKCKMRAIQFNRDIPDSDFDQAVRMRDETPDIEAGSKTVGIPVPDLKLKPEELEQIRGKRYKPVGRDRSNKRATFHLPYGPGSKQPTAKPTGDAEATETPDTGISTPIPAEEIPDASTTAEQIAGNRTAAGPSKQEQVDEDEGEDDDSGDSSSSESDETGSEDEEDEDEDEDDETGFPERFGPEEYDEEERGFSSNEDDQDV